MPDKLKDSLGSTTSVESPVAPVIQDAVAETAGELTEALERPAEKFLLTYAAFRAFSKRIDENLFTLIERGSIPELTEKGEDLGAEVKALSVFAHHTLTSASVSADLIPG